MDKFRRGLTIFLFFIPALLVSQDHFFSSNGVQIRYIDKGAGTAVLLIHGFSSNLDAAWVSSGVFENLAGDHRVIALDLRGHGKSGKPHDPKAYGDELPQDVIRLLDHLKIQHANIVGHSMGGAVALKLLTTNPDRLLSATLAGSAGRRNWTLEDDRASEEAAAEFETGIPFRSVILRTWPTDQPKPSEETIRRLSQEAIQRGNDPAALAAVVRGQRGLVVTDAELAPVRVPTLAIIGSADSNLPRVNDLKKVLPSLKVEIVDGATHAGERGVVRRPEFVSTLRAWIK